MAVAIDALRFQQWYFKSQLTPSSYTSVTSAVVKVLHSVTSQPSSLNLGWAKVFVQAYVQDAATHLLQYLTEPRIEESLTPNELAVRSYVLRLASILATKENGWTDLAALVDLAMVYGETNPQTIEKIYTMILHRDVSLLETFTSEVVTTLAGCLVQIDNNAQKSRRTVFMLKQLFRCGDIVIKAFLENIDFVKNLAKCYHSATEKLALRLDDNTKDDWLYVKIGILDTLHAAIETLTQTAIEADREMLFSILFTILELPSSSGQDKTPFISQSLLGDYEYAFNLSEKLLNKFASLDDARIDLLVATLKESTVVYSSATIKPASGIASILKSMPHTIQTPAFSSSELKGKAKAEASEENNVDVVELAISQVFDIFPSHTPSYIRRCLNHPNFQGNTEKLISALLEGTLPPELQDPSDSSPFETPPQKEEFHYTQNRQNVWDEVPMDISRLRIGKASNEDVLDDRAFIEQMKADIIRRAEELSEDEDEEYSGGGEAVVAFYDDLDDEDTALEGTIKVAAGEGSDTEEDTQAVEPTIPTPETILELAYLENPKLFDRDAQTRRSKSRAELKAKSGWSDEQIEGWRIMLERNPKKDKILSKHEFKGNKPLHAEDGTQPGPSSEVHGDRGGGSSSRGGLGGNAARDRAWKDRNKARRGNHNRKRGHDKKMARMAPSMG